MPSINLETAVAMIYQIVDQRRKRKPPQPSPFFFIVGAGISNPPIPLAREIEIHCKQEAARYGEIASPESDKAIDTYSHWFGKAYPSPEGIQDYLRGLMERQPISKANLRLAHLVLDGAIARTVFTPNFDDMLSKALELFGQRPLVCDHPLTVGRMRIDSPDIQIIHVHGSYWFYDCVNLHRDIVDHSGNPPMSIMLDQSLRDHSPIVIGYSGWDGDILTSALHRRLSRKLGTPVFWFCYNRASAEMLPRWLTQSNDVYLVVPDDPDPVPAAPRASGQMQPASASAASASKTGDTGSETKRATLTASKALDALVLRFASPAPPLPRDPLGFYADHLLGLLGPSESDSEPDTYYAFHTVIARVQRARDAEATTVEATPDPLQAFRGAMSTANYRDAIKLAGGLDRARLSRQERTELVFSLMSASIGLTDNSAEEMAGYDLVVKMADELERQGPLDARIQERTAKALLYKGITLGELNRDEEAIAVYDEVTRRFGDTKVPGAREQVAGALRNKGATLESLDRNEEAIAAYDEVARRFGDAKEPAIREQVAAVLRNKGVALESLDRNEEAIAAFDEVTRRFGDAKEPAIREQVATALVNRGFALGSLDRSEEEIAAYDEVTRRFGDAAEPGIREQVASALVNKGFALGSLNRNEEAIAAYDEVARRFGDAEEPGIREQVAKALFNKGVRLGSLNRNEEEIAAYDEVARRFGDAEGPGIREQVAKAFVNKGVVLGSLERSEEEIAAYEEVTRRFGDAEQPGIRELVATALVNKGVALGSLNRNEEEIAAYNEVTRRFGDAEEPDIRQQGAKSLLYAGMTYASRDDKERAIAAYERVVEQFAADPEPEIGTLVEDARTRLEGLRATGATPE